MSFIGVDVARAQLEFASRPSGEPGVVPKRGRDPGPRGPLPGTRRHAHPVRGHRGLRGVAGGRARDGRTAGGRRQSRLRTAGKPAKVALTACMRKLLIILNAMARTGVPWRLERTLART